MPRIMSGNQKKCLSRVCIHNPPYGQGFLIVLPETDVNGASVMAERLQSELSQWVTETQGKEIFITASFGVTGFCPDTPDEMISPEAMINKADKYLYQAKREGRNRVMGGALD